MLEIISGLDKDTLGIKAIGKVSAKDYETVIFPEIDKMIKRDEDFKILYFIGDEYESFEWGAVVDDAKLAFHNLSRLKKMALVSDVSWIKNMVKLLKIFIKTEVKVFPSHEIEEAKQWIS